jgi:hypothetical protein
MRRVSPGVAWREMFRMRGLFSAVAGGWSGGGQRRNLVKHELLWDDSDAHAAWMFEPDDPRAAVSGWWLGFMPLNVPVPIHKLPGERLPAVSL